MGFIDAHHKGYTEFIALLFGSHPQTYWYPLIKAAYQMTMCYFKEEGMNNVIDLTFVNITNFSAVMYPQHPETLIEMDNSMANVAKVDSCVTSKQLISLNFIEQETSLTT
jgi:hypothetical protein